MSALVLRLQRFLDPKLVGGVIIVGFSMVGVKLVAFGKELVVAHYFGTSDAVDAFLIALMIPTILAFILGDAFRDAVIPVYSKRRLENREDAARLVSTAVLLFCVLSFFVIALVGAFGRPLIGLLANDFSAEKRELTRKLLMIVFPLAIGFGAGNILKSYLQANGRFRISSSAQAVIPATTILFLLLAHGQPDVRLLAYGTAGGSLVYLYILFRASRKTVEGGLPLQPIWNADTKSVSLHSIPLLAGAAVMEGCFFIDTMMAASLPSGSVAVLSYGGRICTIVLAIGGTAAGQVLFPHISDLAAHERWRQMRQVLVRFSMAVIACALPFVLFFWVAAEPVVRLLLERGEFTADDTIRVAAVLQFAGLQIPGYILAEIGARAVMALRSNYFMVISTSVAMVLNIFLNLIFMKWFGVKGIALSTAVVGLCSATLLFSFVFLNLRKRIR